MVWDPSIMDHEFDEDDQLFDAISDLSADPSTNMFDEFRNCRKLILVNYSHYFDCESENPLDDLINQCVEYAHDVNIPIPTSSYDAFSHDMQTNNKSQLIAVPKVISKKIPDYIQLRPRFGWIKPETIEKTFKLTTQYARHPTGTLLKKTFKSPNPDLNVMRRNESVACDIVYSDTPAVADGSTAAVIFVGIDTQVTDIYGIKTDKQFINMLEDNIIQRGTPNKLIIDRVQVIVSNKVLDILRTYCIKSWQSEPHQQHQNHAERRFQTMQMATNRILDRTGAPA
jgi:hypothetical protein